MNENRGISKKIHLRANLIKALPSLLPSVEIIKTDFAQRIGPAPYDIDVEVRTPIGQKQRLLMEIKCLATPGNIREGIRQLKNYTSNLTKAHPILASSFISPKIREICREEGLGYIDLAGNCYLQFGDFYFEKIVDKNPFPARGRPRSLFTPVSSRIVRAFLEEPQRNWKVLEMARTTKVSLGQAAKTIQRLIEEGYVVKTQRYLRLTQPGQLLDAWREQYRTDKNILVPYYSFIQDPGELMTRVAFIAKSKGWRYAMTSFAAASMVAPFVRGAGTVQWYVDDESTIDQWVTALDLRPVESGANAILLIPYDMGIFYRPQVVNDILLASNLQIYLDLYSNPARGKEQADFLRKEKLDF